MALCVEIADALVDLIDGATFYQDVTVERQWLETQRLEKLQVDDPARVIVVPRTLNVTAFDLKPRTEFAWDIGIWIDKAIDQNNESIDPVADFVELVISLIATNRMLAIPSPPFRANCIGISQDPTYDPTQLLDIKVFRSVFVATYRVIL
jgi:hypothetical protein